MTEEQIRAEFAKLYPSDAAFLHLAENNRDYQLEAIGARHHWGAFKRGAMAVLAASKPSSSHSFVVHPDDPLLQHLPDGTHVILQRKLPR